MGDHPTGHSIEWWLDGDMVTGHIACHEPAGAACRVTCPEGCEDACEHPLKDVPYCNAIGWIEDASVEDCYDGPRVRLTNGPIDVEWNGDGYTWRYPPAADAETMGTTT